MIVLTTSLILPNGCMHNNDFFDDTVRKPEHTIEYYSYYTEIFE